jgi:hypothetical protein
MLRSIPALIGLAATTACLTTSEPASPCPALDLGRADIATFVSPADAPVIAVAADPEPFVTHQVCDDGVCRLHKTALPRLQAGSELLLTASGRYLVGINESFGVVTYAIDADAPADEAVQWVTSALPTDELRLPRHLIASLRGEDGDDWIIARDADGQLLRYRPGAARADQLAPGHGDLGVAAVGERHVIGREIHSGGEETLYVVDVVGSDFEDARPLLRGPTFSRITVTPRDDMVIATAGEGEDAETFVFDVATSSLLDRFRGAAISGRASGEDLPGMRAVSPDGSALAYRTPMGAVALRGLDTHSSCLVRSAAGGSHAVAGFSADGVLYLEADEGAGRSQVFAFDPPTRRLAALGDRERGMKLVAVPGREVRADQDEDEDEDGSIVAHWALAVSHGQFEAVLENGGSEALAVDEIAILARDDAAVWLVDTSRAEGSFNNERLLRVRRLAPQLAATPRRLEFDYDAETMPELYDPAGESLGHFEVEIEQRASVCVTTGAPGSWGFGCGGASSQLLFEMSPGDREQQADPGANPIEQNDEPEPPPTTPGDDADPPAP